MLEEEVLEVEVLVVSVVEVKVLEETVNVAAVDEEFDCEEDPCVKVRNMEETLVEEYGRAKNVALIVELEPGFKELDVGLPFETGALTTTTVEKLALDLPVRDVVFVSANEEKVEVNL